MTIKLEILEFMNFMTLKVVHQNYGSPISRVQ